MGAVGYRGRNEKIQKTGRDMYSVRDRIKYVISDEAKIQSVPYPRLEQHNLIIWTHHTNWWLETKQQQNNH